MWTRGPPARTSFVAEVLPWWCEMWDVGGLWRGRSTVAYGGVQWRTVLRCGAAVVVQRGCGIGHWYACGGREGHVSSCPVC